MNRERDDHAVIPLKLVVFFIESTLNELADLNKRNNAKAETHSNEVLLPTDGDHSEHACKRRDKNDHGGENERKKS